MSQQAARIFPEVTGNTAHALTPAPAQPHRKASPSRGKSTAPLALVVSKPKPKYTQLIVIVVAVWVAFLALALVMSIQVSKGQYELVGLKNTQLDLHKSNQALEQELAAKAAPQKLVANAAALGMVPAGETGQIDVRTQKVSGSPQAAKADTKGLVRIPEANIDKPKPVVEEEPEPAPKAVAAKKTQAPAPAAKAVDALKGGTIPAPAQKAAAG